MDSDVVVTLHREWGGGGGGALVAQATAWLCRTFVCTVFCIPYYHTTKGEVKTERYREATMEVHHYEK